MDDSIYSYSIISNGKTELEDLSDEISKKSFELNPNYVKIEDTYHSFVKAIGYPRKVEDGWLQAFMSKNDGYDISIHIEPSSINQMLVFLHNQIIRQTSDLITSTSKGTPNPSLEIKLSDTKKLHNELYKGSEKLFGVSLYINNKSDSKQKLDLLLSKCKANLNSMLIMPKQISYSISEGLVSTMPLGLDVIGERRDFPTTTLAATFPFLSPSSSSKSGILFAHEESTLNPIFIDFNSMSNKHFFVIGISGSGKSYASKYLIMQALFSEDVKVHILDPNAEYNQLCNSLGGANIELSRDSENCINVFDLAGEDFGSKLLSLLSVFDILTGGLSEAQKGVLNNVLPKVYARKGIYADDPTTWILEPPIFSDMYAELWDTLKSYSARTGKSSQDIRRSIEVLLNRVGMYTKNGFFGFLDRPTKISLDKQLMNFDLSNLPSSVKPLVMFSVMDFISRQIRKDMKPKMLLIDEGWALLRSKEAESYLLDFIKTSRKYGASIGFVTQEIEDLLKSEGGRSVLNMTSTKILMRQNSTNMDQISRLLKLNENENEFLLRCRKGHGILITEKGHYKFFTQASRKMHDIITTDPDEVDKLKSELRRVLSSKGSELLDIAKKESESKIFKPDDTFYDMAELEKSQIEQLLRLDYVELNTTKFGRGGSTHFLVKPSSNETPMHHFLCKVVGEELRKYTTKIEFKQTSEPDVIASINGKKLYFEIETGSWSKGGKRRLCEKFEPLCKKYGKNIYIVVAKKSLKSRYKKYGTVLTRTDIKSKLPQIIKKCA